VGLIGRTGEKYRVWKIIAIEAVSLMIKRGRLTHFCIVSQILDTKLIADIKIIHAVMG